LLALQGENLVGFSAFSSYTSTPRFVIFTATNCIVQTETLAQSNRESPFAAPSWLNTFFALQFSIFLCFLLLFSRNIPQQSVVRFLQFAGSKATKCWLVNGNRCIVAHSTERYQSLWSAHLTGKPFQRVLSGSKHIANEMPKHNKRCDSLAAWKGPRELSHSIIIIMLPQLPTDNRDGERAREQRTFVV